MIDRSRWFRQARALWPTRLLFLLACFSIAAAVAAQTKNGFDLSHASIPDQQILAGGPPRDGIPAIDDPVFEAATDASFVTESDRVLGIYRNGIAKAYPIPIMNWHEIVNDEFAGEGIAVTYCPLCGTGMAFVATIDGRRSQFGVSGLLYNSDVLLYDRETESLWSQIGARAVSGARNGQRLVMVSMAHTTWKDWVTRHPGTLVLSTETGYRRDYQRNPYSNYEQSRSLFFPASQSSDRYHPKEMVIGLALNGRYKAYPFAELACAGATIQDRLSGQPVTVEFDADNRTGRILDRQGKEIPTVIAYWFAWTAFHERSEVYSACS